MSRMGAGAVGGEDDASGGAAVVSNGRSVGKARGLVPGRAGRAVTLILATLTLLSVPVALALLLIPPLAVERNYGGVAFPLLTGVLVPLTGWTGLPLGFLTLPLLLLAFLLLLLDGRRRLRTRLLNALGRASCREGVEGLVVAVCVKT